MTEPIIRDNHQIRVNTTPDQVPNNTIIYLGDQRDYFEEDATVDVIDQTAVPPADLIDTATISDVRFKRFDRLVVGDIATYYDSSITTLAQLRRAMKRTYGTSFSTNSYVTIVDFALTGD